MILSCYCGKCSFCNKFPQFIFSFLYIGKRWDRNGLIHEQKPEKFGSELISWASHSFKKHITFYAYLNYYTKLKGYYEERDRILPTNSWQPYKGVREDPYDVI
jgi:hypothetical protein